MPLLPELRRAASNEPPRVHWHHEPQNSGWGLLTELVGLRGCGFYNYGAPDGARNCAVGWARRLPGFGRRFSAFTRWNRTEGALSLMDWSARLLELRPRAGPRSAFILASWRLGVIRNLFRTSGFGVGQLRVRAESHAKTTRR